MTRALFPSVSPIGGPGHPSSAGSGDTRPLLPLLDKPLSPLSLKVRSLGESLWISDRTAGTVESDQHPSVKPPPPPSLVTPLCPQTDPHGPRPPSVELPPGHALHRPAPSIQNHVTKSAYTVACDIGQLSL